MLADTTIIQITHTDGKTASVELHPLSIRQLYKFINAIGDGDAPALVAICARKSIEWIDTLTLDSFAQLSKKATEINFPKAVTLAQTDPVAATRLAPHIIRKMDAAKYHGRNSGGSLTPPLPAPQPAASAEATPSASSTSPQPPSNASSPPASDSGQGINSPPSTP